MLLPPSEGKNRPQAAAMAPTEAAPNQNSFEVLAPSRQQVMQALVAVSSTPEALEVLKVGASLEDEVRGNLELATAPVAPAHSIYAGVLYDALGYSSLTPAQRRKADECVVVVSALWGAVGFAETIPAYRLSMGTALPGLGKLASWWKPRLTPVLDARAGGELVVDLRSSTYAAAYKAPVASTVAVDVVQERAGVRKVVSHFAKHTRGELARLLVTRRAQHPSTPEELHALAQGWWPGTELVPATKTKAARLVIVLPEDHRFTARE